MLPKGYPKLVAIQPCVRCHFMTALAVAIWNKKPRRLRTRETKPARCDRCESNSSVQVKTLLRQFSESSFFDAAGGKARGERDCLVLANRLVPHLIFAHLPTVSSGCSF